MFSVDEASSFFEKVQLHFELADLFVELVLLGVGLLPPQPEWGAMIAEALPYMADQPMMVGAPTIFIFLATWSAILIGEAYAGRNNPS